MKIRLGLSVPNRGVVIGAGDPQDLLAMCELADRSELFDAVFTGDSLISKPRIDAIVFLAMVAGRTCRVHTAKKRSDQGVHQCGNRCPTPWTSILMAA